MLLHRPVVQSLGIAVTCLIVMSQGFGCQDKVLLVVSDGNPGSGNEALISCDEATSSTQFEWPAWAAGKEVPTGIPFISSTYSALEGPGVYVASRDRFQVYVNGVLVGVSSDERAPSFFSVSLLPGENVVAVAVAAHDGTPAALVHLSELEREYESDGSWLVSTDPQEGWMDLAFDDSKWSNAVELGDRGEVPGCDPEKGFPATSRARWIGPRLGSTKAIVLRKRVWIMPSGFGEETTGGDREQTILVRTWEEFRDAVESDDPTLVLLPEGSYDFRPAARGDEVCPIECPDEPGKIQNQKLVNDSVCPDPQIPIERRERSVDIGSNTTIVGMGRGALIRGVTLGIHDESNVIIRNLGIFDINPHMLEAGDAFGLSDATKVWIDHCSARWISDGFVDVREGSSDITLSYLYFDGENEAVCGGRHQVPSTITDATVTIHHSRFDNVALRAPLGTGSAAMIHLFNNSYSNVSEWAIGAECFAQVRVEGTVFKNAVASTNRGECEESDGPGLINAVAGEKNVYRDESNVHLGGSASEPVDAVFEVPYEYPLETAADALLVVDVRSGAGSIWPLQMVRD